MANDMMVKDLDEVVVRFSGDSGDGMQLAGNIFSTVSATVGNDISTFPDYPADIPTVQLSSIPTLFRSPILKKQPSKLKTLSKRWVSSKKFRLYHYDGERLLGFHRNGQ